MVRKTLQAITNTISSLREAAFWLSLFALFSQLLALVRDRMLSHHFGAGVELDTYYAAFKIPDLIFVTAASLVSLSALVPLFAKKESEGEKHLKEATDSIFTAFSVLIVLICAVVWFALPLLVPIVFAGFSPSVQEETIFLSRILLLSPLLLGFSNFFGAIVQYEKRFILYSLSPLLYNLCIILGLVFGVEKFGINSAVFGVVLGALAHMVLPALFIIRSGKRPHWITKIKWKDVLETAGISIPRTLALSTTAFVAFFFAGMASRLGEGSVAVFNLSFNLQSAPLSLIGVSLSLAAFPALAILAAKKDFAEMIERAVEGLRQIIFWSLPATALIIVLRAHIVRLVLGSGNFNWDATRLTAAVLALFVLSTVFQSIQLFLSRFHYALSKTKWPILGNVLSGAVTLFLAIIFIKEYEYFSPLFVWLGEMLNIGHLPLSILALPLAFSIGSLFGALVLFLGLGAEFYKKVWQKIHRVLFEAILASLFAGFGAYLSLSLTDQIFDLNTFVGLLAHGAIGGVAGIACGAILLYLVGNQELRLVVGRD